jgi:hypothetical protein
VLFDIKSLTSFPHEKQLSLFFLVPTLRRHVSERLNFSHCATPLLLPAAKSIKSSRVLGVQHDDRQTARHAVLFVAKTRLTARGGTLFGAKSLGLSRVKFMAFSGAVGRARAYTASSRENFLSLRAVER